MRLLRGGSGENDGTRKLVAVPLERVGCVAPAPPLRDFVPALSLWCKSVAAAWTCSRGRQT